MTITSKKENQNYASRIEIERGEIINQKPSNRDIGTTVEVASLFEKVPARLKFLKTNRIEMTHCKDCLLYTSPSPRDGLLSRMPSSA